MVAGASLGVTGILRNGITLPNSVSPPEKPLGARSYNLADIVDQHLGITGSFSKRLESRVQGGLSEVLLDEGYEAWLKSISENPTRWRIIKVHHVVPTTDILGDKLRQRVRGLFTSSLIYRSPSVGAPHGSSFEGEYITDIWVWHHMKGWTAGIQFVKSNLECSPIYGIKDRESNDTHPPVLLSGNGNALLGISGAYTSDHICQLKAVWRSDVAVQRQRHTQTSFTGSNIGIIFNDLQYLADPASARIVQITARAGGSLADLRTTYESVCGGGLVRCEAAAHGWDFGPTKTMILEEDEYIIGVRGSHNYHWIHQLQFVTNKREHPPFGADKGNVSFSFNAPKTIDGKNMVLHYMAGKRQVATRSLHSTEFLLVQD
ncbi:unnamed protein product [Rhizoctonia solani]|uniref:Jacalin-type lectin domain-containing protein n=1 Tax=Rhizoctonia solani TaxID=456999 RepID=A0A8H3CQA9_9AGAM|nr:unnamed protein product [Rhizoctonia solani]